MAVYELPVRMTKVRFFDIVKNALKLYIGLGKDVLSRMIYMLESTSGLAGDAEFGDADLSKIDSEALQEKYDYLNDLAGICNYICVIGRCSDEVRAEEREKVESLLKLIKASSSLDEGSDAGEAEKILTELEGRLEELSEKRLTLEAKLEGYLESEGKPDEEAVKLESMRRLMSTSVYAELEMAEIGNADETDVESEFKKLSEKLDIAFKNGNSALNRARQAAVLSTLPVFFNSRTEVMDYVRESLSACSNIHEKNTAVSKILKMEF
jgi:tellurite resistance protein